jgi:hypothetical protein
MHETDLHLSTRLGLRLGDPVLFGDCAQATTLRGAQHWWPFKESAPRSLISRAIPRDSLQQHEFAKTLRVND